MMPIMMFSLNTPNTSNPIVILCIISCKDLFVFILLHLDVFVTLFPNSSWFLRYHLELVGDVRMYPVYGLEYIKDTYHTNLILESV
jgi:hypothetical protein